MKTRYLARLLLIAVACGFSACAKVGPDYAPPAVEVPPGWNQLDSAPQAATDAAIAGDLSRWWRVFRDPLLTALVDEALQASPDLRLAQARLREARGRRMVAAAGQFPSVTATGNARRSELSEEAGSGASSNLFNAGFDADWELDVFGGVRRAVEASEADLEASGASVNDTRVSLASEVALNYVQVRSLQSRLSIARDNLASQSETLRLTEWRAQAGLVGSQDVEQARSNRAQTLAQIPSLKISLAEAEHGLDILLGKPPGSLHERLAAAGSLPVAPAQVAVGIPADTLRRRPDIRAAERSLAAETARVGVAEAARYPSFSLSGSIGLEALHLGDLGNSGAVNSSLLAGVTAPIFNAGRLRSQVEIQDAVREQALVTYEQTVLSALLEVENSLVSLARNNERGQALATAAEAARNAAVMARQRYSAGLIDFQSVLDTERNVLSVEDSLATTRADSVLALIRLYKALGGGWPIPADSSPSEKDLP